MDVPTLTGAVSSFKDFLSSTGLSKNDPVISNIREDMRHFLRLFKYRSETSLKEILIEINDALDELYEVIVIELNAIDVNTFIGNKDRKSSNDKITNTTNDNTRTKKTGHELIIPNVPKT